MPIIAIISQKGGAGKTTLALHLAAAAEEAGDTALVIDLDPQATASQWGAWREDAAPVVIDCAPPRLAAKIAAARERGAEFIVIDTPPHSDSAASAAAALADLVLIPCRPAAFDLAAIQTTASLVRLRGVAAFAVFTAGSPRAPNAYRFAGEIVAGYGIAACPLTLPDRAVFRHAVAEGKSVIEAEPAGKAAAEVRALYRWAREQVNLQTKGAET